MTYNALKLYHVFISADHYFQRKNYVFANKKPLDSNKNFHYLKCLAFFIDCFLA